MVGGDSHKHYRMEKWDPLRVLHSSGKAKVAGKEGRMASESSSDGEEPRKISPIHVQATVVSSHLGEGDLALLT